MLTLRRQIIAACAAVAMSFAASSSHATNESHATMVEAMLLPKYCWSQYIPNMQGPEYQILGCGVGMNHFCDGLVELNRARLPTTKRGERISKLKVAKSAMEYTIRWMQGYPKCPIRSQVETTLREIDFQLRSYGQK